MDKIVFNKKITNKIYEQILKEYLPIYEEEMKKTNDLKTSLNMTSDYGVLIKKASDKVELIYGMKDIMEMFDCSRTTALKLFHMMEQCGKATKQGKTFITTSTQLLAYIDNNMGQEIYL